MNVKERHVISLKKTFSQTVKILKLIDDKPQNSGINRKLYNLWALSTVEGTLIPFLNKDAPNLAHAGGLCLSSPTLPD